MKTRTVIDEGKFDMELLPAGTRFTLSFEYMVLEKGLSANITEYFVAALSALESGEIPIGKRKRRGFGRCHAENWSVY
ncbi:RAMP superfamily CRISPR-associated protein [Calorimonas adulescens]|uniref:RAMP superfamily CRISPR-associated protein n=1 Tax=Calorimonas adulescens TaxID=2606906 RepID=UPI001396BE2D|nr:RAMP superfamily CRISPR-associated protein [Calorimonas adulescens]